MLDPLTITIVMAIVAIVGAIVVYWIQDYQNWKRYLLTKFIPLARGPRSRNPNIIEDPKETNPPTFKEVVNNLKSGGNEYDPVMDRFIGGGDDMYEDDLMIYNILRMYYIHVMNIKVPLKVRKKALRRATRYTRPWGMRRIKKELSIG